MRNVFRLSCALLLLGFSACNPGPSQRDAIQRTTNQVERIAGELDRQTTDTGVYVQAAAKQIQERDAWGNPLQIVYAQGGVAETVTVRSAGPDRELGTKDDIVASCTSVNLKGVGEGIKQNAEETATSAAKGLVKGLVEGAKETIRDAKQPQPDEAAKAAKSTD